MCSDLQMTQSSLQVFFQEGQHLSHFSRSQASDGTQLYWIIASQLYNYNFMNIKIINNNFINYKFYKIIIYYFFRYIHDITSFLSQHLVSPYYLLTRAILFLSKIIQNQAYLCLWTIFLFIINQNQAYSCLWTKPRILVLLSTTVPITTEFLLPS